MRRCPAGWRTVLGGCGLVLALIAAPSARGGDAVPNAPDGWLPPSVADDAGLGPGPELPRKTLLQWSYGTHFAGGADRDQPLQTDRPDFTEASCTVGRGVVQLEFGYTYFYDQAGQRSSSVHSIGEPLLRCGLGWEWLEFRVATNYLSESRRENGVASREGGASDLYLGFKIALTPQEGLLPELAVTPQVLLPTGSPPFMTGGVPTPGTDELPSSHRVAPGVNWLYSWELNEHFNLGASTQFNRTDDDETRQVYTEFAQSCVLHWGVTERWDVYGEWYALLPIGADTAQPEQYLSGGLIFYLTKNLQLDARGGAGLNDAAANYLVGAGGAVRF